MTALRMPSAFLSYSHDSIRHKKWVKTLCERLCGDGVNVKLDQWELVPGDQLPQFMEKSIRENDFVLIVCTPNYKLKSDSRIGGVGYEGDIITSEIAQKSNHRKFVPILRTGEWENSAPSWMLGKYYLDFRNRHFPRKNYKLLLSTLHGLNTMPDIQPNWELEAIKAAKAINKHFYEAHRGAIRWSDDVVAVFLNRYPDEMLLFRKKLSELGINELASAVTGGTTAILLYSDDAWAFDKLIWQCSVRQDAPYLITQQQTAFNFIWQFWTRPYTKDEP